LDLDGTVYRGTEVIPEAKIFIERLQQKGIEPFYVTNNASMTQKQLGDKLARFGIKADNSRIISSAVAAAKYIKHWHPGKTVFMIGSIGLENALLQEGIERVKENGDIVLMGIDRNINFDKLANASLEVRKGAIFLSTNGDLAYPSEKGLIPGNGAYTTLVAASTGVEPMYIGKPEMHMLEAIMMDFGFEKSEMVMIGDNYDTDIKAGIHFGIDTIHVNTGVTSTEEALQKAIKPTYTVESLDLFEALNTK
jgi:4-nitrophenyl phosphatase